MDRIFIASVIGIIYLGIVLFLFIRKRRNIASKYEANSQTDNAKKSPFLQEQTIRLEDGRFGMRVEFLKSDLDLAEIAEAGGAVFELKKFLELARSTKRPLQQEEVYDSKQDTEPAETELDLEVPSLLDYDHQEDEPEDSMGADNVYLAEKFVLPPGEDLLTEEDIVKS